MCVCWVGGWGELGRRTEIIKTLCVCMCLCVFLFSKINRSLLLLLFFPENIQSLYFLKQSKDLFCLSNR